MCRAAITASVCRKSLLFCANGCKSTEPDTAKHIMAHCDALSSSRLITKMADANESKHRAMAEKECLKF